MAVETIDKGKAITQLLNGTLSAIKDIVPIEFKMQKSQLVNKDFHLYVGVLIGIAGDFQGKLVFTGKQPTFGAIGEKCSVCL